MNVGKRQSTRGAGLAAALLAAAFALCACSEKVQTAGTRKSDGKPWEANQSAFMASGFKGGDKAAWEAQMRQRAQSQNEHSRTAAKPR